MALASFVLSMLWFFGIGSLLSVFFCLVARQQIGESEGAQRGEGLAVAGIVLGTIRLVWASYSSR